MIKNIKNNVQIETFAGEKSSKTVIIIVTEPRTKHDLKITKIKTNSTLNSDLNLNLNNRSKLFCKSHTGNHFIHKSSLLFFHITKHQRKRCLSEMAARSEQYINQ